MPYNPAVGHPLDLDPLPLAMFIVRSILTFFISTVAFLFLFLANLSGARAPFVRNLYFSEIEDDLMSYIWTLYNFCSYTGKQLTGTNVCTPSLPGYAYRPYLFASGFSNRSAYSNGSRAAYAFILLALLTTVLANVINIYSFYTRSVRWFKIYRYVTIAALLFIFLGATISTAIHRSGVKIIAKEGYFKARMGSTMMAFVWLPVVLQLLAVLIGYFWKVEDPLLTLPHNDVEMSSSDKNSNASKRDVM